MTNVQKTRDSLSPVRGDLPIPILPAENKKNKTIKKRILKPKMKITSRVIKPKQTKPREKSPEIQIRAQTTPNEEAVRTIILTGDSILTLRPQILLKIE